MKGRTKCAATLLALTLALTCAAVPALAASTDASVSIVCSCTVDGVETQPDGFSVTATNQQGSEITSAQRDEAVTFIAVCPDGYYVSGWSLEANGEDALEFSGIDWAVSDDLRTLTLLLDDNPEITQVQATAEFLTEPPTEGSVQLHLSAAAAEGTPEDIVSGVTLKASNLLLKEVTSAEPGQIILVEADVPAGCHVREWRAAAGALDVPLDSDGLNQTQFVVPDEAGDELNIEAIIEPGLALLLGLTMDGAAAGELDVHPVALNEQGDQVSSLNIGETVSISADMPSEFILDTVAFYPYPEDDDLIDVGAFLTVVRSDDEKNTVTVTLDRMPPLNGITAVMEFSEPAGLSVTVTPEDGGAVTITPDTPQPGDTVELQAAAADGFTFDGWVVTSEDIDALELMITEENPDAAVFVMPDGSVEVGAQFMLSREVLEALLEDARELAAGVHVSDSDGADVPEGQVWTTPESAQTFADAVTAAQDALDTPDSDLTEAIANLQTAYNTFTASIEGAGAPAVDAEIAEVNGIHVVTGLSLNPQTGTAPAVADLMLGLDAVDIEVQITLADGSDPEEDATCATGMVAVGTDSALPATVVVRGDVLGNGRISLSQLTRTASAFAGTNPLEGAYLLAADVTGTGTVDLTDLVFAAQLYSAYTSDQQRAD